MVTFRYLEKIAAWDDALAKRDHARLVELHRRAKEFVRRDMTSEQMQKYVQNYETSSKMYRIATSVGSWVSLGLSDMFLFKKSLPVRSVYHLVKEVLEEDFKPQP